jgi:energy-coupling factor transporter ATP-binding protein EcfA2
VQHARLKKGSILLVDEVEHGLEPHRLINVLQRLKAAASEGQVILTTHSPGSIAELSADQLHVVRDGGRDLKLVRATDAFEPPEVTDPQALVRACPEALLARRILVGEGPTEAGFFRGLALERWEPQRGERIAAKGSVCIDGGGDPQCIHRARGFAKLGYPTALLMDTDTSSDRSAAITAGVKLIEWAGGTAIEQRIALDIPAGAMAEFVKLAVSLGELEQSVRDAVASRLGILKNPLSGLDPIDWMTTELGDQTVREAIGGPRERRSGSSHSARDDL